jgi:hypothetical protein
MNWFRTDKEGNVVEYTELSQFPESIHGFVYMITNTKTGKFYIGKKILRNTLTKKMTKKEISEWSKPGRVPKKKKEIKESNWRTYWGSNQELKDDVKSLGEGSFERKILQFCFSSKQLTYFEMLWQLQHNVLCSSNSYNDQILGKFYRRDLEGTCE